MKVGKFYQQNDNFKEVIHMQFPLIKYIQCPMFIMSYISDERIKQLKEWKDYTIKQPVFNFPQLIFICISSVFGKEKHLVPC